MDRVAPIELKMKGQPIETLIIDAGIQYVLISELVPVIISERMAITA
jgi:hypothetical protein